jgi:hypothetical protein
LSAASFSHTSVGCARTLWQVAVYEGSENFCTSFYRPVEETGDDGEDGGDARMNSTQEVGDTGFMATVPDYDVIIVSFDTARSELEDPLAIAADKPVAPKAGVGADDPAMEELVRPAALDRQGSEGCGGAGPRLRAKDFTRALVPPLSRFIFWRVIVDEFQELDGKGVVAKLQNRRAWKATDWEDQRRRHFAAHPLCLDTLHPLQRHNSWLLSGTPLGADINGLTPAVRFVGMDSEYNEDFQKSIFNTLRGFNSAAGPCAGGKEQAQKIVNRLVERIMW